MGVVYGTRDVQESFVKDVLCDRCGATTKTLGDFEYATLSASWGYGSSKDMICHEAHFCEECFDEILSVIGVDPSKIER